MKEEAFENLCLKLKKALLGIKAEYIESGQVNIVKHLDANGVRRNGSTYLKSLDWKNIFLDDQKIIDIARELAKSYKTTSVRRRKKAEVCPELYRKGTGIDNPLAVFTGAQLLAELRRRGYSWNEMYVTTRTKVVI